MNWGPIEIGGFLVLLFGSLFGAFAVSTVRAIRRNNAQPVRSIQVQVVTKNDGLFTRNTRKVVDFRTEDGEGLQLSVTDDAAYYQMTEGMSGMLTFQGWNYKNFVPTEPPVTSPSSASD